MLGLTAYADDGTALNWEGYEESLHIEPDQYDSVERSGITVHLNLDLPTGVDIHLVTALYDLTSGMAGTLEIPLQASSHLRSNKSEPSELKHP